MKKYHNIALLIFCMLIGGFLSIHCGQATNEFDVYNYHIYAPWAFLHDRVGFDIIPSGIRSYFNPMLDIPYLFLIKFMNSAPKFVAFVQGFYWGGVVFLGYKISALLSFENVLLNKIYKLLTFSLIISLPILYFLCGSVYVDLQVAIIVLLAIYLDLKFIFEEKTQNSICSSIVVGFILGAVFGLKLTSAAMILGIFISSVLMIKFIKHPQKIFLFSLIGFILGFLLINGIWYYKIYYVFKNPFFPYFDNIFHSPFGEGSLIINDSYTRAIPQDFMYKLLYPFRTFFDTDFSFGSWLFRYKDTRTLLIFLILPFVIIKSLWKSASNINNKKLLFLSLFYTSTYIIWLNTTPIVRYIIPLTVVACVIISYTFVAILKNINSNMIKVALAAAFLSVILLYSDVEKNDIRQPFNKTVFEKIEFSVPDNSLVFLSGQKTAYVIPQLNPNARYVLLVIPKHIPIENGAYCYSDTRTIDYYHSDYFQNQIANLAKEHKNLYLIYNKNAYNREGNLYKKALKYYIGDKQYSTIHYDLDSYTGICKISPF